MKTYNVLALTGGNTRYLDSISIINLNNNDRAICYLDTDEILFFEFSSTSILAETTTTHPFSIRPDDYSSGGVWIEHEFPKNFRNYTSSTGSGTLINYGSGFIICDATGVRILDPIKGSKIDVICNSTNPVYFKGSTQANITWGSSDHVIKINPTTQHAPFGFGFSLIGRSSIAWEIMQPLGSSGGVIPTISGVGSTT